MIIIIFLFYFFIYFFICLFYDIYNYGIVDSPYRDAGLTKEGINQCALLNKIWGMLEITTEIKPTLVLVSPLSRAIQTLLQLTPNRTDSFIHLLIYFTHILVKITYTNFFSIQ